MLSAISLIDLLLRSPALSSNLRMLPYGVSTQLAMSSVIFVCLFVYLFGFLNPHEQYIDLCYQLCSSVWLADHCQYVHPKRQKF